jgi:hypothetical protein
MLVQSFIRIGVKDELYLIMRQRGWKRRECDIHHLMRRRLTLPAGISDWSLTSLQQRLVKTGGCRRPCRSDYHFYMVRELRLRDGRIARVPRPLETSKIVKVVEQYRGRTYIIFVDESMRAFFGFDQPNGYLCYAVVGVPEEEYEYLRRAMGKVFIEYEAFVVGDSGVKLKEFKFDRFKPLPADQRSYLAKKIQ